MKAMLHLPRLLLDHGAVAALPDELARLGVRKPLLMSDAGLVACGIVARVRAVAPAGTEVFDRVTENPIFADCDSAAAAYHAAGCDGIVALGGGSVIDAAKLTAVVAGHGGCSADFAGHSERIGARVAPLLAIPTTAGTGSEASPASGVHPDPTSRALGIGSPFIVPKTAICDPDLTLSLPPSLTAATGIDALTHCIEGYLATSVSPPVDALALDGIRRIVAHLERAVRDGGDRDARRELMLAAFAGGAAISKGLGPGHAIAIGCGDQGVHHGKLSAIGLLAWLGAIPAGSASRLRDIADAMGAEPDGDVGAALLGLMTRVGLPATLAAAGYRMGDPGALAAVAAASHFNASSPYRPDAAEYAAMLASVGG